ncbi:hypothetical protein [Adhaeribacter pallidiroseus]|uniref:Uncharacterized protein n=1 Tax=Adhaeribacter pallidiroseus TaxID=2072847 RepID=A0A369QPZ9_9BACT|nr:hypothetical protein [Adhaeribacter pallidiroseus]RDC65317.1 hypothetical protein AHMF7616_03947 [Adhaeribacter pallidiroseus]
MKKETEVTRDPLTQQLITKATPLPELKVDFTAQVMAQIEVQTQAQRAKIYEPLIPAQVWRWIVIALSSMVLLVLALSALAFRPTVSFGFGNAFNSSLKEFLSFSQLSYLPQLILAGVICFCWLLLDYLYGQLRKS